MCDATWGRRLRNREPPAARTTAAWASTRPRQASLLAAAGHGGEHGVGLRPAWRVAVIAGRRQQDGTRERICWNHPRAPGWETRAAGVSTQHPAGHPIQCPWSAAATTQVTAAPAHPCGGAGQQAHSRHPCAWHGSEGFPGPPAEASGLRAQRQRETGDGGDGWREFCFPPPLDDWRQQQQLLWKVPRCPRPVPPRRCAAEPLMLPGAHPGPAQRPLEPVALASAAWTPHGLPRRFRRC